MPIAWDELDDPELRPEGARLVALVGWLTPRPEDDTDHSDVPEEKQENPR